MSKIHDLYKKALLADKAFHEALLKEYGSLAGDKRYDTKNQPLHIQALGKVYQAAMDDYLNEVKGNR